MKIGNNKELILSKDFFNITKTDRWLIMSFLIGLTFIWSIPVYSLIKNSLKVNGLSNYIFCISKQS